MVCILGMNNHSTGTCRFDSSFLELSCFDRIQGFLETFLEFVLALES